MSNAEPNADGNSGGHDQSFRFLIRPTIGGNQERVRFSNLYGTTPVTLGAARLSLGEDDSTAVDARLDVALTFGGQAAVTLQPGQVITSDPVRLTFSFGQTLAVSVFLRGDFGPVSHHNSYFIRNWRSPAGSGDVTSDIAGASFTAAQHDWLLLSGLDVYGPYRGTLVLFGSSTTDGYKADYSSDKVYPVPNSPVPGQHASRMSDWLAQRLNAAGYRIGVINAGVPGDPITVIPGNAVKSANERVAQDVLTLPNVLGMVTYFGSIDLRSGVCRSAPEMEDATRQLVATAATMKIPLVMATLPPSAFCTNPAQPNFGPSPSPADPYAGGATPGPVNGAETQRMTFNHWVLATGAGLPGVAGILDIDQALADPARPNFMQAPYNSGDNYHPNGEGYRAIANALPLGFLGTP